MSEYQSGKHRELDALIIGGGISGLSIGNVMARRGMHVHVVENSGQLGGSVRSEMKDGYLCEAGPNSMLVKSQEVWDYLDDLGLAESRVEANPAAAKRFLVKNGRVVALPSSPLGGITTPLYSFPQKLRLLAEPFISKSRLDDESVSSFVSRRMGPAFLEYGISALVSGIFAGNPDHLSIRHAFPKVWNLEQNYGSLIGGALKLKRQRKREGVVPFKSRMISFQKGLQELIEALVKAGNMTCSLDTKVTRIERASDDSWQVQTQLGEDRFSFKTRQLIIATPVDAWVDLPFSGPVRTRLSALPEIDHPPLSTLVLGYPRSRVAHPLDGFGVLFPRMENRFALGCIFSSSLFPNRAPEDKVSLMCFIGGTQQPGNGSMDTSSLVRNTVDDLRPLLGLEDDPEFVSHAFWPRAIPQYKVGYGYFLDGLKSIEKDFSGLHLQGNFRGGPGLNDCLQSALQFGQQSPPTV